MKIYINDKEVEVTGQLPLIEEIRKLGIHVPSLCYAQGVEHHASCMVCMVENVQRGQLIPSCSTFPEEGMRIATDTDEVKRMRRMAADLLTSDHRADCEAPCTIVCPHGLDPAQIILYYDRGQKAQARSLILQKCPSGQLPCHDCKASCEKACRRGAVDKCVPIRDILASLLAEDSLPQVPAESMACTDKTVFSSKLGRYSDAEKEWLREEYATSSRCLHCACEGRDKCRLRQFTTEAGIKSSRFGVSTSLPVKVQEKVGTRLRFEPAKCIRCGLCVYNSNDGFTFQHRGFDMRVVLPEESRGNVDESLASLCPTGALFLEK